MRLCGFDIGLNQPFFLIAGPCVIESEQLQMDTAGTLKDITRFGQDAASQEYENAFRRYLAERQQKLAPLEYRIGLGQTAAGNIAGDVGVSARGVGQLTTSLGDIRSAGIMGQSNAYNNMLGDISGLATDAASAYGQYQAAQPYQNYLRSITPTNSAMGFASPGQRA